MQVFDVGIEFVSQHIETLGGVLGEQGVFDAVEAGEVFSGHAFLMVINPGVDRRVEVTEQFGDRLNRLVMHAGRCVELFGGGQVALFDGVGELLGFLRQRVDFIGDVNLVVRYRLHQVQWCIRREYRERGVEQT